MQPLLCGRSRRTLALEDGENFPENGPGNIRRRRDARFSAPTIKRPARKQIPRPLSTPIARSSPSRDFPLAVFVQARYCSAAFMNYRISQRAASLSPSLTLAIDAKAKQMIVDGMDDVGFGMGESVIDTTYCMKDCVSRALAEGFTKYTRSLGVPELRQA